MRNIFQNKKVLISIIAVVVIIVVAVVLFVVLGKSGNNKKSDGNSSIKFSEENKVTDKTLAGNDTSSNKTENGNSTSSDSSIGSDVEDFHKKAAEQFVKAFMDEEEMKDFLENYVDIKAYVAYENVDGDETKFWDEYESIADDDPAIEETKQACLAVPSSYNTMLTILDSAIQMAKQYSEMANQTGNLVDDNTVNNTVDFDSITDEDKKLVLKAIKNPEKSENDENITRVTITCSWMQEDVDLDMVFYGDVVIFICDEEGTSLTESALGQDSEMSEFGEEN